MPRLLVEKGRDKGKAIRLKDNAIILVGRDVKTNLRVGDLQASRRHFKVSARLGEYKLEDLDSSNGTFVNGKRVRAAILAGGDKIELGETVVYFLEDEGDETTGRKGELTGQEISGYRIGRLLGRGGMGTVYEAIQISLERKVAFKVLAKELAADAQFVERFAAEARAAGGLNHPNIVQVYDVGSSNTDRAVRYYSMEYMANGSVDDLLRKDGRLPFARCLPILFDTARGLEYAERHGVVHRDIKPQNLFISDENIVKIGDLGIAQRRRVDGDASKRDETVSGSPHYMAPEQARGEQIDGRADLYALGISLWEMLAGEPPFDGSSAREVILKHLNEPLPPLAPKAPDAAPEVLTLVERLTQKDPKARVPGAKALLAELVEIARRTDLSNDTRLRIEAVATSAHQLAAAIAAPSSTATSSFPLPSQISDTATSEVKPVLPGTPTMPIELAPAPRVPTDPMAPPLQVGRWLAALAVFFVCASLAGTAGFLFVRELRARRAAAREAAEDLLARLRGEVSGPVIPSEERAQALERELVEPLERAGQPDLAATARRLLQDVSARRVEAARAEGELRASTVYGELDDRLKKARDIAVKTEATVAELRTIAAALKDLASVAPATSAGRAARDLVSAIDDDVRRAGEDIEARKKLGEEAEVAFGKRLEMIENLLPKGELKDARRFIKMFEADWAAVPATPERVKRLDALVLDAATKELEKARAEVSGFLVQRAFDDARRPLKRLKEQVEGLPIERDVALELARVDAAEKGSADADAERTRRADQARLKEALDAIAERTSLRHYGDAAKRLEVTLSIVTTREVREQLERRIRRLKAARDAIERVVARINAKPGKSGISETFSHLDTVAPCPAIKADDRRVTFRVDEARHEEVLFAKVRTDRLHEWVQRTIEQRDDGQGYAVALALDLELGRLAYAQDDRALARRALEAKKDKRAEELLVELERDLQEAQAGGGSKPPDDD